MKSVTESPKLYAAFEMPNFGPRFSHFCIYPREGNPVYHSKLGGKLIQNGRYGKRNVVYKFSLSQIDVPLNKMSMINVTVIQRFSCVCFYSDAFWLVSLSYVVNMGLIDKLYGCFLSIQGPIDESPKMSAFLEQATAFLHGMCKLCFAVTGR